MMRITALMTLLGLCLVGCDRAPIERTIEVKPTIIVKEEAKEQPKPKKVKEICIGSVLGAKDRKITGEWKDGKQEPDEYEILPAREARHEIWNLKSFAQQDGLETRRWSDYPFESLAACLKRGFQPTGEWVVLPGSKSHYSNSHYPPSAFMMFVKYEE
jgi:hypothetical protein